jgi:hypothetical protein
MNEDGGYYAVKIFTGPDPREQAIRYAEQEFGEHDEIRPPRYPAAKPNQPLTDLTAAPPPAGQTRRTPRRCSRPLKAYAILFLAPMTLIPGPHLFANFTRP